VTAALDAPPVRVTEPGLITGLPEDAYHADPVPAGSLSHSGAKQLLPPSCPALFFWHQDHPRQKKEWDFGTAAHKLVLHSGPEIVVVDADSWRTNAAKEAAKEARERGAVPLLAKDWAEAQQMADAIRCHPIAGALLDPATGQPEVSAFWQDDDTGTWCRCRYDFLPHDDGGRLLLVDYKSAASASPEKFRKAAADHGYHIQDAWYSGAARVLGLDDDPAFLFVVQEKTPPYLVSVVQLDEPARRAGAAAGRKAIGIYQDCVASGEWPGYCDDVELISLPPWATREDH
jgi:PDDEXK-like uncharacterized protein DUF3799